MPCFIINILFFTCSLHWYLRNRIHHRSVIKFQLSKVNFSDYDTVNSRALTVAQFPDLGNLPLIMGLAVAAVPIGVGQYMASAD